MTSTVVPCPACATKNRVPAAATGLPRCASCKAVLPWVVDADDESFPQVADASSVPVLVDLWAPWCGPCRKVSPTLERLAHDFAGRVKLVKVNVDGSPGLARRFEARSIPTLVLTRDGRELARQIGAAPEAALRGWLEQALQAS